MGTPKIPTSPSPPPLDPLLESLEFDSGLLEPPGFDRGLLELPGQDSEMGRFEWAIQGVKISVSTKERGVMTGFPRKSYTMEIMLYTYVIMYHSSDGCDSIVKQNLERSERQKANLKGTEQLNVRLFE